jgi:hypothetical protein
LADNSFTGATACLVAQVDSIKTRVESAYAFQRLLATGAAALGQHVHRRRGGPSASAATEADRLKAHLLELEAQDCMMWS